MTGGWDDNCGGRAIWYRIGSAAATVGFSVRVSGLKFLLTPDTCNHVQLKESESTIFVTKFPSIPRGFALALGFFFALSGIAVAHSGIVDGYGCHRGPDKVSYHCHQGQFAGRTFKSKEDFLRELRGGKSGQLSPKNNPPPPEKKFDK